MPHSPPFTITPAILSLVAEIAGEVGRLGAMAGHGIVPKLNHLKPFNRAHLRVVRIPSISNCHERRPEPI